MQRRAPPGSLRGMSLLQRAARAAATAKNQLDEVREVRAAASVQPVASQGLSDHEQHLVMRARELGAPDPFVLLSGAEASEAVGQPLGGPHLTYGDDFLGVRFEAAAKGGRHWRVSVSAFHAVDEAGFEAAAHWFHFLRELVIEDGVLVPGLGDETVRRDREVFVLADPLLLMVEVGTPDGAEVDGARAVELARRVVGRLLG
jgi:hypothetical protein